MKNTDKMGKKKNHRFQKTKTARSSIFGTVDKVIIGICIFCILLSGAGIWYETLDYFKAKKMYGDLQKYIALVEETSPAVEEQTYSIDWKSLQTVNPDVVAWIKIPSTVVDYPIVQAKDNQYYLKKGFDGKKNSCGTIFMNTDNRMDFSDDNTVLYGHNMKNGSMFAVLNKYREEAFYKEHKEVWLFTPYWERKYQIISAHKAADGSETYAAEFGDRYAEHVAKEASMSIYDTGNGYNVDIPMVTLSTCTGHGALDRMVLICQPVYEMKLDPFIQDSDTVS